VGVWLGEEHTAALDADLHLANLGTPKIDDELFELVVAAVMQFLQLVQLKVFLRLSSHKST